MAKFFISKLAGQIDFWGNLPNIYYSIGLGGALLGNSGIDSFHFVIRRMNLKSELSAHIWNWYCGFFFSMGHILAATIAFIIAILLVHVLYILAKNIESKPTPVPLSSANINLLKFAAIIAGALLIPFIISGIYYPLSNLVYKLMPKPVEAPPVDFGSMPEDVWFSSMSSLIIYISILALIITFTIFFLLLRKYVNKINSEEVPDGFVNRILKNYFHDHKFVGFLLTLTICPVLLFFFYQVAWLVLILSPFVRQELPKLAFPSAENIYFKGLQVIGSWFIVILCIPAIWLLLRGVFLKYRYTIENPTLKRIFIRSVKFILIGFLGWLGCFSMHYLTYLVLKIFCQ